MYVLSTSHSKWCRTYLDVEDEEEEHEAHEQTHDVSGTESDQQIQADVVEKHLACEIPHTGVSHQHSASLVQGNAHRRPIKKQRTPNNANP